MGGKDMTTEYDTFLNTKGIFIFALWFVLVALSAYLSWSTTKLYESGKKGTTKGCYPGDFNGFGLISEPTDPDSDDCYPGSDNIQSKLFGSGSMYEDSAMAILYYNLIAKPTTVEWDGDWGHFCLIGWCAFFVGMVLVVMNLTANSRKKGPMLMWSRLTWMVCLLLTPLLVKLIPWQLKSPEVDDDGVVEKIDWDNLKYAPFYLQPRFWSWFAMAVIMTVTMFAMYKYRNQVKTSMQSNESQSKLLEKVISSAVKP